MYLVNVVLSKEQTIRNLYFLMTNANYLIYEYFPRLAFSRVIDART